jgi:hypothetical protein
MDACQNLDHRLDPRGTLAAQVNGVLGVAGSVCRSSNAEGREVAGSGVLKVPSVDEEQGAQQRVVLQE